MAERKRIVWTKRAIESRRAILTYWTRRNQSALYSKKLKHQFEKVLDGVAQMPDLGISINSHLKVIISGSYKIFYTYSTTEIQVLYIWDTRRHPEDLTF